jgi:hypothetical protein
MGEVFTDAQVEQIVLKTLNGGSRCIRGERIDGEVGHLKQEVVDVKLDIAEGFKETHGRVTEIKNDIKWFQRWMMGIGGSILVTVIVATLLGTF